MPARAPKHTIIARPQRMMSRIVTTSSPAPTRTAAKMKKRASPQSWPRSTSMIAAMVKTAPITANARTIGISLRSTSPLLGVDRRDRRPVPVVPVMSVVQVAAVVGTLAVVVRLDATDRRRQDSQQASGVDQTALGCRPGGPVGLAPDVCDLGLAIDGGDRHQVDHRLLAARVG